MARKPSPLSRPEGDESIPYWRLSGFYFFYFAALGTLLPYWPLYLQSLGFAPGQIGAVMAVMAATKIVAPNLWGWIADRTGRGLTVIRFGSLCTVAAFCAIFRLGDFLAMALGTFLYSFFWNAILPSFEALTLSHLRSRPERYSRVRLWGSIGFIVGVLAVGRALDAYPIAYLPYAVAGLLGGMWLLSLLVPPGAPHGDVAGAASFRRLLWRGEVLALLAVALLVQLAHGPYYVFFTLYLKDHGYNGAQAGQLWSLGVMAEVVLFMGVTRLLRRVSLRNLLLGSLVLGALRWWTIAVAVEQPLVLAAAQLLHAATFGATHVTAIHLIHHHFGGAHHSKGQALYNSAGYGVGGMLGSYVSGALWMQWGGPLVYTGAAAASLLALLIAWLGIGSAHARATAA